MDNRRARVRLIKRHFNIVKFKDGEAIASERGLDYFRKELNPIIVDKIFSSYSEAINLSKKYNESLN